MLPLTDNGWVYQCSVTTMVKCITPPHALSKPKSCQCRQLVMAGLVHCCLKILHVICYTYTTPQVFIQAVFQKQNETIVQHGIESICKA